MKNIIALLSLSLFAFNACAHGVGKAAAHGNAAEVSVFDLQSAKNGATSKITLSSGYEMPILGLGTYSLHGETCKKAVRSALEQGVP